MGHLLLLALKHPKILTNSREVTGIAAHKETAA
jgi:hypothetical protein